MLYAFRNSAGPKPAGFAVTNGTITFSKQRIRERLFVLGKGQYTLYAYWPLVRLRDR